MERRIILFGVFFLFCSLAVAQGTEIYSWKDANGKTVISDRPPRSEDKAADVTSAPYTPNKDSGSSSDSIDRVYNQTHQTSAKSSNAQSETQPAQGDFDLKDMNPDDLKKYLSSKGIDVDGGAEQLKQYMSKMGVDGSSGGCQ